MRDDHQGVGLQIGFDPDRLRSSLLGGTHRISLSQRASEILNIRGPHLKKTHRWHVRHLDGVQLGGVPADEGEGLFVTEDAQGVDLFDFGDGGRRHRATGHHDGRGLDHRLELCLHIGRSCDFEIDHHRTSTGIDHVQLREQRGDPLEIIRIRFHDQKSEFIDRFEARRFESGAVSGVEELGRHRLHPRLDRAW